ncbi:NAD(P)-dependent alcohol dehydrogenase [Frankia sp. AgB32]|uniref:NAD(P)-dependent alcohol dehydrogenase n=1 Tax=Frankia sp. AgB32 TaxID=631119 RepID=UPI00200FA8B7|nr:NAD(P)-dependent alcohol dehydrogenase [Frankia sp. AgB32]MCK9893473.1 NAD(P)-dependent alcohol dehydrogenase [Frankia sp. AgB32]
MTSSRGAVLRGADQPYVLETVEINAPRPDEVLVRVVATGLCHTELLARKGMFGPKFLPAILGHEGAGVVEQVGSAVTAVVPGDHVVLSFDSCGQCRACARGLPTSCASFELLNLTGTRADGTGSARDADGNPLTSRWFGQSSFSEFALATARNVAKVDKGAPLELLGPLGCGVQTGAGAVLNQLRLAAGESVVIFGVGAVGLSAVLAARLSGAGEIVAVDLSPARRELALDLGATRAVDGADPDLARLLVTQGRFDASLDTTGVGTVMATAVNVLDRPGSCVLLGAGRDTLTVHPTVLSGRSVTYGFEGGSIPSIFIPRLVDLWQRGLFPFDRLIRTYPLAEINQAEADAAAGVAIKPVLLMHDHPSGSWALPRT